jgi:RNA polymerase sigma-70 factor (ECF subfamily)
MTAINDRLLVSRAALLGDKGAFCRLVEAYQSSIRRFLFNLTDGDEELSKDLAQEAFVKAWLNIGSFRAAAKFSTWLFRIAYNVFYDHARSAKQTLDIDEVHEFSLPLPDADRQIDFARALGSLKNDERTAMLLFYMEDMSVGKIAAIMNCPAGTVKSHLFRGKQKLSEYLKHSGYDK